AAQRTADQIYLDARQPTDETSLRWTEFASLILKLLGPVTASISSEIAGLMDFGVWMAGASQQGRPGGDEVRFKADEVGSELIKQGQQAQATYQRIGDIVVSDYHKLREVGANAFCNDSSCDRRFAFTEREKTEVSVSIARGIQRILYEKLLPLGFNVF